MKRYVIIILIINVLLNVHAFNFDVRISIMGGLVDERAPDKKLGGGQIAFDAKYEKIPLAFSISLEYHKKSPDAINPYEIESLIAFNALYHTSIFKDRANIYIGGGPGVLYVPKINNPDVNERGILLNSVATINYNAFWKIGFYFEGKYIFASKSVNNTKVIDFSDIGFFIGLSLNFD